MARLFVIRFECDRYGDHSCDTDQLCDVQDATLKTFLQQTMLTVKRFPLKYYYKQKKIEDMLKTYNTIDKDELQIGDTILLSMTRGNNGKIMIEVGERVINNTRAIVVMNQSDSRHTPGIRRAKFPAEPYDILVGLGIQYN